MSDVYVVGTKFIVGCEEELRGVFIYKQGNDVIHKALV